MENRIMIPVKEMQVGDLVVFGPATAFAGVQGVELLTEEVVGVAINLPHRTVDLRTESRAVFDIPMDLEIEVVRN